MNLFGCYTSGPNNSWNPSTDAATNANWEAGVRAFGKAVGQDVNCVNVFPCWGSMNDWPGNLQGIVNGVLKSGYGKNMAVVVGLKMFSQKNGADHAPNGYQWNDGAGYADVASGKWDNVWRGIVKALAGLPYAMIRFSDEYNGSFMEDFMGWDANAETAWLAGFNRGASVMKQEIANSKVPVEIALNPDIMVNCPGVSSHLPDLANFDVIAADWYNGYWDKGDVNNPVDRRACWKAPNGGFGLDEYLALLKSTGKKAFFAECGSGLSANGVEHGMLNDASYWPCMAETIKAIRAQGTTYLGMCPWDLNPGDGGWRFSDGTQPQCLSDFRANVQTFIGDDVMGSGGRATAAPAPAPAPVAVQAADPAASGASTTAAAIPVPMSSSSFTPALVGEFHPDVLVLRMSEDAYQGDAQFTISVDGQPIGGTQTVKAPHGSGQSQNFVVKGHFPSGQHTVSVQFLNDAWGGTPATDRNLYVNDATVNGVAIPGSTLVLEANGSKSFTFQMAR